MPIDFTDVEAGQYPVIVLEANTGIVLNSQYGYLITTESPPFVGSTLTEARAYANSVVANPRFECSIRDHNGDQIELVKAPNRSW